MKLQKTDTTNRLKTLVQMKKARAAATWLPSGRRRTWKPSRFAMKNQ